MNAPIEQRSPALVLVLSIFTCGLYLLYWYAKMYEELELLTGEPPTHTGYWLDLLFVIVTCGLYGVWVDYKLSERMRDYEASLGTPHPRDTTTLAVVLDVTAYITGFVTNFVSSAIHQDQFNKLLTSPRLPEPLGYRATPPRLG
jgi:hypothetical protein